MKNLLWEESYNIERNIRIYECLRILWAFSWPYRDENKNFDAKSLFSYLSCLSALQEVFKWKIFIWCKINRPLLNECPLYREFLKRVWLKNSPFQVLVSALTWFYWILNIEHGPSSSHIRVWCMHAGYFCTLVFTAMGVMKLFYKRFTFFFFMRNLALKALNFSQKSLALSSKSFSLLYEFF